LASSAKYEGLGFDRIVSLLNEEGVPSKDRAAVAQLVVKGIS
jgi:hypothetical protein